MRIANKTITRPQTLALLCLAALGCSSATADSKVEAQAPASVELTAPQLRALGPQGLKTALAKYDQLPTGPAKEEQARIVDSVAGQRYATSSRLYWYTDLERAKAAAKKTNTPILSLRMLGRLDEDFSCANSRLFRTVLYSNAAVSSYLRENFTLHWSSERPVPKVTVAFGGGRVLKSTIAGNSAHYLLTNDGTPVDVLPGLFSPKAFVDTLEPSRRFANSLKRGDSMARRIREHHETLSRRGAKEFERLPVAQRSALTPYRVRAVGRELLGAEMLTVTKSMIEMPIAKSLSAGDTEVLDASAVLRAVTSTEPLDENSRELIIAMGPTDWGTEPAKLKGSALAMMFAELERQVAGDTLINRHGLYSLIHALFIQDASRNFETLNSLIYSDIFVTPASDPWLGMGREQGFTGLPRDGLPTQ